ncbi:MAG: hypothetical protein AB1782_18060 [Cyanobacteriota bacterium]
MGFVSDIISKFSGNKEEKFWNWIIENKERLENLKSEPLQLMQEISPALKKYNKSITLEVGCNKNNKIDLIISADGVKDFFPIVEKLTSVAPELDNWNIIAFRPRRTLENKINLSGIDFDPCEIKLKVNCSDNAFDIDIYHPDLTETNFALIASGCFILLDIALGEYNVAKKVRYIDFKKLPEKYDNLELIAFTGLAEAFDNFYQS